MSYSIRFLEDKWNPMLMGTANALVFLGLAQGIDFGEVDDGAIVACGAISGILSMPLVALAEKIHSVESFEEGKRKAYKVVPTYVGLSMGASSLAMKGVTSMVGWDASYPVTLVLSGVGIVSNIGLGAIRKGGMKLLDCCMNRQQE